MMSPLVVSGASALKAGVLLVWPVPPLAMGMVATVEMVATPDPISCVLKTNPLAKSSRPTAFVKSMLAVLVSR